MRNRLLVSEGVYFQGCGGQPKGVSRPWGVWLNSDEEPYGPRIQRLKAAEGWVELQTAWISSASMLHVEHRRAQYEVQPEDEQAEADAAVRVELTQDVRSVAFCSLPPGADARFPCGVKLYARVVGGDAIIVVFAIPE